MSELSGQKNHIEELERIIESELQKSPDKVDEDFVDECLKLIAQEKGIRTELSEDEINVKINEIIHDSDAANDVKNEIVSRPGIWKKRITVLLIAAILLICMSASACAFIPQLRNWICSVLSIPMGDEIHEEDVAITYIHLNEQKTYPSVEALLDAEEIKILFPATFGKRIMLKKIHVFDDSEASEGFIQLCFSSENCSEWVYLTDHMVSDNCIEVRTIQSVDFYIFDYSTCYYAFCGYKDKYYCFGATQYETLIDMLENLKGY